MPQRRRRWRNVGRSRVLGVAVTRWCGSAVLWVAGLLLVALLVSVPAPSEARARVFVGGAIGVPVYPYPYPYPYYTYPAPYPWEPYPAAPPAGWVPGHWEWRYDPWGRPYRAWIPSHLQ